MSLLIIIGCILGICKLISAASAASKERARQAQLERIRREQERVKLEQARQREAWKAAQAAERERVRQMVALEREQARQAKEQERLAKEQERQAAQLSKHEKRLADLEERMAVAEGEIEFQAQQIERLREHIEHAETERDACVYGSSRYYQWDKKCLALEKQIHTAESKMAKAQYTIAMAKREIES